MKKSILLLLLVFIYSVFINSNIKAAELNYETELILTDSEAVYGIDECIELKDGTGVFQGNYFIYTSINNAEQEEIQIFEDYKDILTYYVNTPYSQWPSGREWFQDFIHSPYYNKVIFYVDLELLPTEFIYNGYISQIIGECKIVNGCWAYFLSEKAVGYSDENCENLITIQDGVGYFELINETLSIYKFIIIIQNNEFLKEPLLGAYVKLEELPRYNINGSIKTPLDFEYFGIVEGCWSESKVIFNYNTIKSEFYAETIFIPDTDYFYSDGQTAAEKQLHASFYVNFTDENDIEIPIDKIIKIKIEYTMYNNKKFLFFSTGKKKKTIISEFDSTDVYYELDIKSGWQAFLYGPLLFEYSTFDCIQKGPFDVTNSKGSMTYNWKIIEKDHIPFSGQTALKYFEKDIDVLEFSYLIIDTIYIYNKENIKIEYSPIWQSGEPESALLNFIKKIVKYIIIFIILYFVIKLVISFIKNRRSNNLTINNHYHTFKRNRK